VERLASELRGLGSHFTLGKTALLNAERFGLDALEWPILDALRERTTLPELEARHRDLDPRTVQSVIYALIASRECMVELIESEAPRTRPISAEMSVSFKPRTGEYTVPHPSSGTVEIDSRVVPSRTMSRTPPGALPVVDATPRVSSRTGMPVVDATAIPRTMSRTPGVDATAVPRTMSRTPGPQPIVDATAVPRTMSRTPTPVVDSPSGRTSGGIAIPRTTSARPSPYTDDSPVPRSMPSGSQNAVSPLRTVATGGTMPPESRTRTPVPSAPLEPRVRTPVTSPPLEPRVRTPAGNPAMARTVSGNPAIARTASASGGMSLPRTISQGASGEFFSEGSDRTRQALDDAAEDFKLGQAALRENQIDVAIAYLARASTLAPHEFDHSAVLAFAQFVGSTPAERTKAADKVRKMLSHATQKSRDPEQARFYLGQVEQLLGRTKEALACFQEILKAVPDHTDATAAISTLEDKALEKSGFGLFRKK
jgi:hypothetical protein